MKFGLELGEWQGDKGWNRGIGSRIWLRFLLRWLEASGRWLPGVAKSRINVTERLCCPRQSKR